MSRIRGIIFDLDNTLLASNIDFPNMKKQVIYRLQEWNFPELEKSIWKIGIAGTLKQASEILSKEQIQELWRIVGDFEAKGVRNARLYEGVIPVLERLQRMNVRMCLITNNSRQALDTIFNEFEIDHYFDPKLSRDDIQDVKPSPKSFSFVQECWELSSNSIIVIGDSWQDGQAAAGASMRFVLINGDIQTFQSQGIKIWRNLTSFSEFFNLVNDF